jgi:hypothetical protein
MARICEEWPRLKFLAEHGRAEEKVYIAFIEVEAKERIANAGPKPKTRFVMETDCPEMYSRLNAIKDRWFRVIVNKSVAVSLIVQALEKYDDNDLRLAAEGVEEISAIDSIAEGAH